MVYENIITGVEGDKLLPYEKCLEHGAAVLDNAELLAAIIRTGTNGLSYMICRLQTLCRLRV